MVGTANEFSQTDRGLFNCRANRFQYTRRGSCWSVCVKHLKLNFNLSSACDVVRRMPDFFEDTVASVTVDIPQIDA